MVLRLLIFNLIYILLFNGLTDWYFYRHAIRKSRKRWLGIAHWTLDGLFVAAMVTVIALTFLDAGVSPRAMQVVMFLFLLVYLPKLVYMFLSLPSFVSRNRTYKRVVYGIAGIVAVVIFCSMLYGNLIGQHTVRVERVTVESSKIPEAFDGYRFGLIADLHLGNMKNDKLLEKVLLEMDRLRPDAILFAGDLVHIRASEAPQFREVLSKYHAPDGIFTVMGNHDYGDYARWPDREAYERNLADLKEFYREIGWVLLDNESVVLRRDTASVALIGVENWGEPPFQQYGDLGKAMRGVDPKMYKVLITHNPNHWIEEVKDKTDIDLSVSGHTHAMQLAIRIGDKRYSPSAWQYELWGGLYRHHEQYIYVNEGIGTTLLPFRLGATPEVTLITLKREEP